MRAAALPGHEQKWTLVVWTGSPCPESKSSRPLPSALPAPSRPPPSPLPAPSSPPPASRAAARLPPTWVAVAVPRDAHAPAVARVHARQRRAVDAAVYALKPVPAAACRHVVHHGAQVSSQHSSCGGPKSFAEPCQGPFPTTDVCVPQIYTPAGTPTAVLLGPSCPANPAPRVWVTWVFTV